MATPPHNEVCNNSDAAPRRVDPSSAVVRGRARRVQRERIGLRAYLVNAVAIGIAVLVAPALSTSSATVAVPLTVPTAVASPAAAEPTPAPTEEPRTGPDRDAVRDSLDHDDTFAPPPPPGGSVTANGTDFVSPVPGAITGGFGQRFHPILHYWRMHNGVDMHASCGTVVVAAYRGTVVQAGVNGGYGNLIVVDHGRYKGKQVISKYAHLSRIGVRVGDKVATGQGIALSGTTGLSTGCHLHFEIKENGGYVDPAPYLTGKSSPRPTGPIKDLGKPDGPGPSATPSPTPTKSVTASPTPKPTATPSKTATPAPTTSTSPSPSATPTPTTSPTPTPTPTPTPSPARTPASTPSATARQSESSRPDPTRSSRADTSPAPDDSERESTPPAPSPSASPTP